MLADEVIVPGNRARQSLAVLAVWATLPKKAKLEGFVLGFLEMV